MTYMLLTIHFFLYFLHRDASVEPEGWELFHKHLIGWLIIVSIGHQLYLEFLQARGQICKHIIKFKNMNDFFQLFATTWIVITNLIGYPLPDLASQRVLAGFIVISQLVKIVLDWLRLFD